MNEILGKTRVAEIVTRMEVSAPHIARKAKPGQFVILRVAEEGERIPLTIFSADARKGAITLIFQKAGKTTLHLDTLEPGDSLHDLTGPLGNPTHIENVGRVVSVSGGVGAAIGYPVTRGFKEAGNHVTGILGARTESLLLLEDELRAISDEFHVCTDDGSKGRRGFVSDVLGDMIREGNGIDLVIAVGPLPMMKVICDVTRPHGIRTLVSLDSLMLDGTGMCGVCRVVVGGETKFTCVDGPDFDGHKVDWDILRLRKSFYAEQEKISKERWLERCECAPAARTQAGG
ncbi:MAG: sulfide/dihydroorotate dehydrogenase-like FAD/NAD-binding protein [bacterium]